MKKEMKKFTMDSVDDLFTTDEERINNQLEKIIDISLDKISSFPNHPFRVVHNEEMNELAKSIKIHGVLSPALVRPKDGGYEMIAGHRRKFASELSENNLMPCIIRDLSDEEATIIMVDSNIQREDVLPSEKAHAYKMRYDAMKRQGERTDLTSGENHQRLETRQVLAEQVGESENKVRQFLRLAELIPDILEMVDNGMAITPAVNISYLKNEEQQWLYETMKSEDCTPSLSQAKQLKVLSQENHIENIDVIFNLLKEKKANQSEKVTLKNKRFYELLPKNYTPRQSEELLLSLLEKWCRERKKEHER